MAHKHIGDNITSNKVVIFISTREISKNTTIKNVAYKANKKSCTVPAKELKITEEEITILKRRNINPTKIISEDRKIPGQCFSDRKILPHKILNER